MAQRFLFLFFNPRSMLDHGGRQISSCYGGPMDPGRESRVTFEQPKFPLRIADHFQLRSSGPIQFPNYFSQRCSETLRYICHLAGPRLSLLSQFTFAHVHSLNYLTVISTETNRFFVAGNMCL